MIMFAREGAKVFGVSRTLLNLEETLGLVNDVGGEGSVFSADLSDPDRAEATVNQCIEEYGRIDILLNAAGVGYNMKDTSIGSMDPIDTTPIDKWREVMSINLDSVFYVSRLVVRQMKKQKKGSIVMVSSIFGLGGAPDAHTYTATKGAIINLTRSMSVAYVDDNIRVNSVAPGFVKTQMVGDGPRSAVLAGEPEADRAHGPAGNAGGSRLRLSLPGLRRGILLHRYHSRGRRRLDRAGMSTAKMGNGAGYRSA